MSSLPLSDSPTDEEFALYRDLEKKGVECGLFDPDFDEPHECTLHIERHFSDNVLRLECEDPSLDLTKPTSKLRTALRDGVGGGYGLVLMEIGNDAELRVLVLQNGEDREWLASVLNRLAEDARAFRRAQPLFGCFPVGCGSCLSAPKRPKQGKPHDSLDDPSLPDSAAAPSQDALGASTHSASRPTAASSSFSFSGTGHKSGHKSAAAVCSSHLPWHRGQREVHAVELSEVKDYARKLWDERNRHLDRRPSFSEKMKRASFISRGRRKSGDLSSPGGDDTSIQQSRSSISNTSGKNEEMGAEMSNQTTAKGDVARLDGTHCTHLLIKMLSRKAPSMLGAEADEAPGGPKLFQDIAAVKGTADRPVPLMDFEEFWAVCQRMMLVEALLKDPEIEDEGRMKLDPATNVHFMEQVKWEWFLVQVQGEKPDKQLAAFGRPELNAEGCITLYGLSRFLCSDENSILDPDRSKVHQDMTQPLTSYWIASSHHVYADAATPLAGSFIGTPRNESGLDSILRVLRCNCRCLSLALVLGPSPGDGSSVAAADELHVLLQQQRVPLAEVLAVIEEHGFSSDKAFPLLLVISLGMLPRSVCANVPQALRDGLGLRLWRNAGPELPSPQDAAGHAIVILSPAGPLGVTAPDPSLTFLPPPALASQRGPSKLTPSSADDADALLEWQEAATRFAVWPGQPFDASLPHRSELEVSVNFLPADEVHVLEEAKHQQLVEYHRQYLTLAFNVAPRCAQVPFHPAGAWSMGIQMAAAAAGVASDAGNIAALVHAGRFVMDNGNCGYVLKPPHLQKQSPEEDGRSKSEEKVKMEMRIIAARAVPGSEGRAGPQGQISVAVAVWGSRDDCDRKTFQHVRPASGHAVDWFEARAQRLQAEAEAKKLKDQNKELGAALKKKLDGPSDLVSFNIASPSTAVITFELIEHPVELNGPALGKSQCLAVFAAPVSGLRNGIRWVPLWTPGSLEESPTEYGPLSGLLVHLEDARKKRAAPRR
mmetsp:Transcript_134308/g.245010  ORF Transcript_134308/g.245010 Transcript_134308/m.245010 type:complete len:996 (+) Transcript_134308:79-3066(+)